ncbi:MAG: type I DNA topoisomerase [Candidatus Aminicenantes bacterium]|nr:type I DNA topoisomerase [Candidatus Aminicenantes bacterium]
MDKSLVIVESPAKAKTINRYLGSNYIVKASMGHIRDLPKNKLGVDVAKNFEPHYVVIPERRKLVNELKKAAESAGAIILAADPDREGEAICWHLSALLEDANKDIYRVLLHEITKHGVEEAIQHMGKLDRNLFNAQQTRRILDRLVGYLISPLLWKKIGRGLSAGRVQSIALLLIVEREKEIRAFVQEEYWTILAHLEASNPPPFKASLAKIEGKKTKVPDGKTAAGIVEQLKGVDFILDKIKVREKKKEPPPPYITSTLQQDAFRLLHFPVRRTMSIAQKLYEGLPLGERGPVGLITYMRTDSVRVSNEAQAWARTYIEQRFSVHHVPAKPRIYKNKSQAQDAHEAVRPTSPELPPEVVKPFLKREEYSLYQLIWNRFLASHMSAANLEETEFQITAGLKYLFSAKGEVLKFDGYLALYPHRENGEKETLPAAQQGEKLKLLNLESKQSFTQPPSQYTEGSLVKELEAKGIGRPSTYAPIITTLQDRVYVVKDKGKFAPTDLGMFVTEFLVKNFSDLMEVKFTAQMEEELDRIEEGQQDWRDSLKRYYERLDRDLKQGMTIESVKGNIPLDEKCPKCGRPLVLKSGKFGRFKACSGYPECKFKESMVKKEVTPLEEKCPVCGAQLVQRHGPYGAFVACSDYPKCKYIKKEQTDTGIACPTGCGGTILKRKTRRGRFFYGCSHFPKCRFATWDEPKVTPCPKCGKPFLLEKRSKKEGTYLHCWDEKCGYTEKPQAKADTKEPEEAAAKEPAKDTAKDEPVGKPGEGNPQAGPTTSS